MLTENEIRNSWQRLFAASTPGPELYDKAEALLEELRAESPLRHRLQMEIEELRRRHQDAEKATKRRTRRKTVTTG